MKQVRFVEPVHHRKTITSNTRRTFEDSLTRILNNKFIPNKYKREFENRNHDLQDRFVDAYTIYIRLYPRKQKSIEHIIRKDWKSFEALFLRQLEPLEEEYIIKYIQTIHAASKYYSIRTLNIDSRDIKASPELHHSHHSSPFDLSISDDDIPIISP